MPPRIRAPQLGERVARCSQNQPLRRPLLRSAPWGAGLEKAVLRATHRLEKAILRKPLLYSLPWRNSLSPSGSYPVGSPYLWGSQPLAGYHRGSQSPYSVP
jgi:hypothetical protein